MVKISTRSYLFKPLVLANDAVQTLKIAAYQTVNRFAHAGPPQGFLEMASVLASQLRTAYRIQQRLGETRNLQIRDETDLNTVPAIRMSPQLLEVRAKVREALCRSLEKDTVKGNIRLLLIGPGRCKTDPQYARIFLSDICDETKRSGEISVYDRDNFPLIRDYYKSISFSPHQLNVHLGDEGDVTGLSGTSAHIIMILHPLEDYGSLRRLFLENIMPGGIVILQKDFRFRERFAQPAGLSEQAKLAEELLPYKGDFIIIDRRFKPLFLTPASLFFEKETHVVILQRRL